MQPPEPSLIQLFLHELQLDEVQALQLLLLQKAEQKMGGGQVTNPIRVSRSRTAYAILLTINYKKL